MPFTWFDLHWPWIGLGLSVILLVLLFATDLFRSEPNTSRWRDPVWLAWLAPASYMIHQFEEYGIDALGRTFAFPDLLCASFGMAPYPECSVPTATFVAINISIIWGAGLVCGLLSWKHPLVGLSVYAIHGTNSLSHLELAVVTETYNPGSVTSAVILLPLFSWVAYAMSDREDVGKSGIATLFGAGILYTVVLLGSLRLFANGVISGDVVVAIQVVNPVVVIAIPWLKENWSHSSEVHHAD
ncbi:HXXEE domain-containing protein [Haloferax sp. ATB1]|uniref:HXXEE domain-containing protein n=1 Tax=Haloferax sp. ATB1 TaxID=1508454 RepID=UPI00069387E5|nr:HXXEE domain-containing protein [Haloferax sp. ATB1]